MFLSKKMLKIYFCARMHKNFYHIVHITRHLIFLYKILKNTKLVDITSSSFSFVQK